MRTFWKDVKVPCGAITINAAAADDSGEPKLPTFSAVAYTGGLIPGYTATPYLDADFVMDLKGMSWSRNLVVNLDHHRTQRVGHGTKVTRSATQLEMEGVFSASTPFRDEVVNSARDGYPWEVSLECECRRAVRIEAGKTVTVNGQQFTGPLFIARQVHVTGLAFVGRGADGGNRVRVAASAAGGSEMQEFNDWLAELGFDAESLSDQQRGVLRLQFEAQRRGAGAGSGGAGGAAGGGTAGAGGAGGGSAAGAAAGSGTAGSGSPYQADLAGTFDGVRAENARHDRIRSIALQFCQTFPAMVDTIERCSQAAIEARLSADQFELQMHREMRPNGGVFNARSRPTPSAVVFEAALARSVKLPGVEKAYPAEAFEQADRAGMRYYGLHQLLMHAAVENGYPAGRGEGIHPGNIRMVLKYAFAENGPGISVRAGAGSTINVPGILSNVANKEILAGYMESDLTWREISQVKSVSDFKQVTSYRLTDGLEYELLPKGGEIKHGTLGEETYTRQARTYAKMLGLDRQDIVNDDLGAFDDVRSRLGMGGATKFNNVFWAAFMNNAAFFTAARGNYIDGATTNLGVDGVGLQAGVTAFDALKSAAVAGEQKRIGGRATVLLVPPELSFIAQMHYASVNVNTGGAATAQSVPNANIFAGLYRPVKSPWLSDSAFTGYSSTAWYLLRAPSVLPAMVVSFLNGQEMPIVESTDADFDVLGILFRGYHDFGCDLAEYLCGVKVKGAAA